MLWSKWERRVGVVELDIVRREANLLQTFRVGLLVEGGLGFTLFDA